MFGPFRLNCLATVNDVAHEAVVSVLAVQSLNSRGYPTIGTFQAKPFLDTANSRNPELALVSSIGLL
jgi:hypothetical protein